MSDVCEGQTETVDSLIAKLTKLRDQGHGGTEVFTFNNDTGERYGLHVRLDEATGDEYPVQLKAGTPVVYFLTD